MFQSLSILANAALFYLLTRKSKSFQQSSFVKPTLNNLASLPIVYASKAVNHTLHLITQ